MMLKYKLNLLRILQKIFHINYLIFFLALHSKTSKTTAKPIKKFLTPVQQPPVANIFDEGLTFIPTSVIDKLIPLKPVPITEEKVNIPEQNLLTDTPPIRLLGKRSNESFRNIQAKESPRKKQKQKQNNQTCCCTNFTEQDLKNLNLESWS